MLDRTSLLSSLVAEPVTFADATPACEQLTGRTVTVELFDGQQVTVPPMAPARLCGDLHPTDPGDGPWGTLTWVGAIRDADGTITTGMALTAFVDATTPADPIVRLTGWVDEGGRWDLSPTADPDVEAVFAPTAAPPATQPATTAQPTPSITTTTTTQPPSAPQTPPATPVQAPAAFTG